MQKHDVHPFWKASRVSINEMLHGKTRYAHSETPQCHVKRLVHQKVEVVQHSVHNGLRSL